MDTSEIKVSTMDNGRNVKCPRCYRWHGATENYGHSPEEIQAKAELSKEKLCDRCQQIILKHYPNHPSAPFIKAAIEFQRNKFQASVPKMSPEEIHAGMRAFTT